MQALFLTTPELLAEHWPEVERRIAPVIDRAAHGEFTVEDLKRLCEEKRAYSVLFDGDSGGKVGMVYEFIFYPRMTACNIVALGGSGLDDIMASFFVTFKKWCYGMGITVIEASCSLAMSRILQRHGWVKTYEVVRNVIQLPDSLPEQRRSRADEP